MSSFSERNPVTIAVVGIAALVTAFLLAINAPRLPLVGGGDTYRAEFSDASGLAVGEEVRVAGIKVGQVTGIELDGATVVVEFRVKGVRLGEATTAGIEVKTLLGQHYLRVSPDGSGSMREGEVIPLSRTTTPLNVVPAFQRLAGQTEDIDTGQLTEAFETIADVLDTTAPEVRGTLTGLARLSRTISSRDDQVEELFARANRVTGVVAARDRELGQLLTASDEVLDVLNRRREVIRQIILGTRTLSAELAGLVEDNRATLGPALDKLDTVLAVLQENDDELRRTLRYGRVYAREFSSVGGSGHWFDSTIKIPRGLGLCTTGPTDPLSQLLGPVLSQINEAANGSSKPCLPLGPAVGSRLEDGAP